MSAIPAILIFVAVLLFYEALERYRQPSPVKERLAQYSMLDEEQQAASQSYFQRRLRPLAQRLAGPFGFLKPLVSRGDVAKKLMWAGDPYGLGEDEFFGLQILAGFGLCLLFLPVYLPRGWSGLVVPLLALVGGLFGPLIWLEGRATERQREISLAVPEALDLLTICVQAGMGFDHALTQIVDRMKGPLAEELGIFLKELRMGVPRTECFKRLRRRNNADELYILTDALVQAHDLGVPIAKTLEEQAGDMRVRRLQRAREEGAKASPKISLITTILVAPAVMCLFLSIMICRIGPDMVTVLGVELPRMLLRVLGWE